jgi:hypothetical protein
MVGRNEVSEMAKTQWKGNEEGRKIAVGQSVVKTKLSEWEYAPPPKKKKKP